MFRTLFAHLEDRLVLLVLVRPRRHAAPPLRGHARAARGFVQRRAERKDIRAVGGFGFKIIFFVAQTTPTQVERLGRDVPSVAVLHLPAFPRDPGDAEVADLVHAVARDEDVIRLHVQVQDAVRVTVRQSGRDVTRETPHVALGEKRHVRRKAHGNASVI